MKPSLYVFALSVCLLSCKKGKDLPHEVAVQFVTIDSSRVYPEDYFSIYTDNYPLGTTVTNISPSYAHDYSENEIASRFNSKLTSFLGKNNVFLQSDTADYVLYIESMQLSESIENESYTDSCSSNYPTAYVYKSSLKFKIKASLYKSGILIDSWSKEANSWEEFRNKRDNCNKPKVRKIIRGTAWLVDQVAKELRVKISKRLYELEH